MEGFIMTCSRCGSQWPMSDCHVCTEGNAGMFGDWQADDVGPEWDDADYNDESPTNEDTP